jgi:hypothetical protein
MITSDVADGFRGNLEITLSVKRKVVEISVRCSGDEPKHFDNMIQIYNEDEAADKTSFSENTSTFITIVKIDKQELDG